LHGKKNKKVNPEREKEWAKIRPANLPRKRACLKNWARQLLLIHCQRKKKTSKERNAPSWEVEEVSAISKKLQKKEEGGLTGGRNHHVPESPVG